MSTSTVIARMVRNANPDEYGDYCFKITGMRSVTIVDRVLFKLQELFKRATKPIACSIFRITNVHGAVPCTLEVYPSRKVQEIIFNSVESVNLNDQL